MIFASVISVPAQWFAGDEVRREVAVFRLGPGACGRTVTKLAVELNAAVASVFQEHDDGSTKVFIYPLGQLTGRIEIEAAE